MLPAPDLATFVKTVVLCITAGFVFVYSPTNLFAARALTADATPSRTAKVRRS